MKLANVIPAGIAALLLHELAHIAIALAFRVKIYNVGISWRGPYLRRERGTSKQNLAITLAGPGANLCLALFFHGVSHSFALCNLVIGITNILPLPASDGARGLQLLAAMRGTPGSSRERGHMGLDVSGPNDATLSSDDLSSKAA